MPELPEVETIVRSLAEGQGSSGTLLGRRVTRAHASWTRTVAAPSAEAFTRRIRGQRVVSVGRRGKFIHISLDKDSLLIHLRMSGDLLLGFAKDPLDSHSRLQIYFDNGLQLSFQDPRKFGRAWLVADPADVLGGLGPEPLGRALTPARFHAMLSARNRQLKPLLLDQGFLAGLGNIYADEALWAARLHPLAAASAVSKPQAGELLRAIRKVLRKAILHNGSSIDWVYRGGENQNHFKVYQRTDEPCERCGTPISRIVVGQRGTHFCAKCQKQSN